MQKNKVLVCFLQDVSGSMDDNGRSPQKWAETASGFRVFVDSLKADPDVEYLLSLTLFNTVADNRFVAQPLRTIDSNYMSWVKPQGGTALYDSLGETIQRNEVAAGLVDKVIYVVVTDGEENASRTWTKETLHSVVDGKLNGGKTTFQYLGAQPETWDEAAKIGIVAGSTVKYDVNNVVGAYAAFSEGINNFSKSAELSCRNITHSYTSADTLRNSGLEFDTTAKVDQP